MKKCFGGFMKHLVYVFALALTLLFAACGDDESSFAPRDDDSSVESSSSSVTPSSNSSITSSNNEIAENSSSSHDGNSSSSACLETAWDYLNPNIDYGEMVDVRDGQTYKTVRIGDQTWMAQNLNYESENSRCYKDDVCNCTKYGRLYTWGMAMDSAGTWSTNGKGCGYNKTCSPTYPVRGICPEGWHLPSWEEWETLLTTVGGLSTAGKVLKSTSDWWDYRGESDNGTDDFGFSALPAGDLSYYTGFTDSQTETVFWSSTEKSNDRSNCLFLHYTSGIASVQYYVMHNRFSVRCEKDY